MKKLKKIVSSELFRIFAGLGFFLIALLFDYLDRIYSYSLRAAIFYILALIIAGAPVFFSALKGIIRRDLLDEKFLMSVASVGAMIIGDMSEGVAVMLFFLVGEYFEHKAVNHSRKSIKALMNIRPDEATVIVGGEEITVDAEDVAVGSEILIRSGERVPIDSVVVSGSADIDTSALTGESIPRAASVGSRVESGSVVISGYLICKTERLAEQSAAARILELVENANERKSREENFITKFSRFYTPIIVGLAVLMALVPPMIIEEMSFSSAVYSALTFLVISCPCALVISVPMAFFGGIGGAASIGILFKGGNVFSSLAKADSFFFDKTGTLTTGRFSVSEIRPSGIDERELLFYAASAEYGSNHPIALAISEASEECVAPDEYREIAGRGVVASVNGKSVLVGNSALLSERGAYIPKEADGAAVLVAINGVYSGAIFVADEIKSEAKSSISRLSRLGAKRIVMLSGDKQSAARAVGESLGINEVYAELLPEEKYRIVEEEAKKSRKTVFVGDGINDAPALALSSVGIAMGGVGSDSAIEAADVVIMADKLDRIPIAVKIARKTVCIAKENIVFALGVKLVILILSAIGFANMWLAVFADVGVAIIAILNSMRTLRKIK